MPRFPTDSRIGRIQTVLCSPRVPQYNAIAERFVRSIKTECLYRLIVLGEEHLRSTLRSYQAHHNWQRNHPGMDNQLQTPKVLPIAGSIRCEKQLGGLLNYFYRQAA